MTTSDTTETDAAVIASGGSWSVVLRETCRRLERERNEWAAMCGRYKQERDEAIRQRNETNKSSKFSCDFNYEEKLRAERERDEAREEWKQQNEALITLALHGDAEIQRLTKERDEAREALEFRRGLYKVQEEYLESERNTRNAIIAKGLELKKQLDEAQAQVKELIYIAERAIALADIDFENDKFGFVSELRGDLEEIKEETK